MKLFTVCWKPPSNSVSENEVIEAFRNKTLSCTGVWSAFWNAVAENALYHMDCGVALVSILGASQNSSTLTVLGGWGPDAAAVYVGRVLPSPWRRLGAPPPSSKPTTAAPVDGPKALTWESGSQLSLPYEWHQLLGQTRFADTLSLTAQLEPLLLGGRLVGALLLVSYSGARTNGQGGKGAREALATSAAAPFNCPVTWTGGERGAEGASEAASSVAASLLRRLKKGSGDAGGRGPSSAPPPSVLRGMAAALSQVALGPRIQSVTRVCSAAQSLASAASLHGLSSVLSATIADCLAADLHVNLAVRVAVVPPTTGQYGYLLPISDLASLSDGPGLASGLFNGEKFVVKRATSSIQLSSATSSARAGRAYGRAGSFSGQVPAPASGPNAIASGPVNALTAKADAGRVAAFSLSSSLLLQLLRGSGRAGNGSVHAGVNSIPSGVGGGAFPSVNFLIANGSYHPEEPTVRGFVSEVAVDITTAPGSKPKAAPSPIGGASPPSGGIPPALAPAQRTSGAPSSASCCLISGMVVSSLHGWMQDVERPSSDVALLMMAARGRGPAMSGAGRPSQGGAGGGGGAMGGGPACLVAVAGCAPPRAGAMAAAAAAAAAAKGSMQSKQDSTADDAWIRSLDTSQRCGVGGRAGAGATGAAVSETSVHRGGYVYSGGPCVALYITAAERLPASLLRAVKDRASALLELLLPACLASVNMGPVRSEVDLLPACCVGVSNASIGGGGAAPGSTTRRLLQVSGSVAGVATPAAAAAASTASASASATPLPSTHVSGSDVQLSQLQAQMQAAAAARGSVGSATPRKGAGAGLSETAEEVTVALGPRSLMRSGAAAAGPVFHSGALSPVLPAAGAPQRAAGGGKSTRDDGAAPPGDGRGSESVAGLLFPVMMGPEREMCVIPQGGTAAQMNGLGTGPALGTSPCCAPPMLPTAGTTTTAPSSQSRTTRGSPGSCGFGGVGGGDFGSMLGSLEVTGAMDDMVSSMRDNLDVWVHSFWEMLKESPAKAGHMHGSYADDDLRFLRLYQRLGTGGAASVYAGVLLGMDVAVKVIDPPPEVDMEALASSMPKGTSGEGEEGGQGTGQGAGSGPGGEAGGEECEGERIASLAAAVRQAQMRELVRSARECAVLTTLSHPAIVQVYSYHTRVQVIPGDGADSLPRLVPVPPGEDKGGAAQGPLHSVLIMERCDLGSLADALDNGMFKKAIIAAASAAPAPAGGGSRSGAGGRLAPPQQQQQQPHSGFSFSSAGGGGGGGGSLATVGGGTAMRAIYLTLLEVALALRHLHAMNLVHCDVKVANVLLKSSASDPRGFNCKLSDFGLVNLLRDEEGEEHEQDEEQEPQGEPGGEAGVGGQAEARGPPAVKPSAGRKPWMRNADAAGTVTHLAPECFEPSSRLDASVDIYAFGIVMWEVFTRKAPYAEFAPTFEGLAARVSEGLRPRFPSHCPPAYRALAQACWCRDAHRRPTATSVVNFLQQLLEGGVGGPQ